MCAGSDSPLSPDDVEVVGLDFRDGVDKVRSSCLGLSLHLDGFILGVIADSLALNSDRPGADRLVLDLFGLRKDDKLGVHLDNRFLCFFNEFVLYLLVVISDVALPVPELSHQHRVLLDLRLFLMPLQLLDLRVMVQLLDAQAGPCVAGEHGPLLDRLLVIELHHILVSDQQSGVLGEGLGTGTRRRPIESLGRRMLGHSSVDDRPLLCLLLLCFDYVLLIVLPL